MDLAMNISRRSAVLLLGAASSVLLTSPRTASAKVVGSLVPASPLTRERVKALPLNDRQIWGDVLDRSDRERHKTVQALKAEFRGGQTTPEKVFPDGKPIKLPLGNVAEWYASVEANALIESVLSFQMPCGGWYKALPRSVVRKPGQAFSPDGSEEATIDNGATTSELRFLSRAALAAKGAARQRLTSSIERGLQFLMDAQYPNGGWPQMWPLRGGYHDGITLNDDATVLTLGVLRSVAEKEAGFSLVGAPLRHRAKASYERGLNLLLRLQVVAAGRRKMWAQQYDPLTLSPAAARNYEPGALASGESASVLDHLMAIKNPPKDVAIAVRSGVHYLNDVRLSGVAWRKKSPEEAYTLFEDKTAGPIWSRYYSIDTDLPVFGDRDKTINDDVNEISAERRNGYSWFNAYGTDVLTKYEQWKKLNI